jgi:hypothetical protein
MARNDRIASPPLRDIPEQDDRILPAGGLQVILALQSHRKSRGLIERIGNASKHSLAFAASNPGPQRRSSDSRRQGSRPEPSDRADLDSPEYREAAEMQSDSCAP